MDCLQGFWNFFWSWKQEIEPPLRYYTIRDDSIFEGEFFGRISGIDSKKVSKKAFVAILKKRKSKDFSIDGKINFSLKDLSDNNIYQFIGEHIPLDPPKINNMYTENDEERTITYAYMNKVESKQIE